jgi:hypothetical protein
MKRLILAALAAAVTWPLAAQSAPPSPDAMATCALQGLSAEQRALAASSGSQQLTGAPTESETQARALLDTVSANVRRCADASRLTEGQRDLALQYTLMQLTREDMLRRYHAQNVDLRFIDEAVAASRTGATLPFDDLVARVRAQGVGDDRPDSAGDIVYIYMMLVYQLAEIRTGFADPNFRLQ